VNCVERKEEIGHRAAFIGEIHAIASSFNKGILPTLLTAATNACAMTNLAGLANTALAQAAQATFLGTLVDGH
jgi:hypothetical protein